MEEPRATAALGGSSDESLAARAQGGDKAALEHLVARHHQALSAMVACHVGDRQRVADIVQEVVVDLLRGLDTYDSALPFRPWLWAVCRHRIARERRRWPPDRTVAEVDDLCAPAATTAEELEESAQRMAALRWCLAELSAAEQDSLRHRYVDGLAVQAMASARGLSAGAMAAALHRLRIRLRRCCERRLAAGGV